MPSASFCLLCLCIAEKVQNPKCSENSQKITEILFRQKTPGARRTSPGGAHSLQVPPRRGPGLAAPGSHLDASSTASRRLFAYKFSPDLKTREHRSFSPETHPSSAATKNPNSGDRSSCSGTLPGLGIAPGAISFDYALLGKWLISGAPILAFCGASRKWWDAPQKSRH